MKKIYVSPSNQQGNIYATGATNEKEQCRKIASACVDFLKKQGFQVMCTYNNDMYERVTESNFFNADMHIAIHTNATAKHNVTGGTQILLYSVDGERQKAGQAILDELAPITPGKTAERLVSKPDFYECRKTTALAVYCECEFHDTKEGSDFIIKNTKKIGEAIARGVCNYYGVTILPTKSETSEKAEAIYTVQTGAFKLKKNAQNHLKALKKAGFDGFIIKK